MKENREAYTDCGILLKQISDHIESQSNRQLQEVGLTLSQYRYLVYLHQSSDPVTFKDVEHHFQTSQPTVSGIMRRLQEKNLIAVEDARTGRAKTARLTERGRLLVEQSGTAREEEEERILGALREDEREPFHDMLLRIRQALSQQDSQT